MKRPADPINRPGRFVEQQVIAGVTLALWCRPLGRGGDAVWTAVLDLPAPSPKPSPAPRKQAPSPRPWPQRSSCSHA